MADSKFACRAAPRSAGFPPAARTRSRTRSATAFLADAEHLDVGQCLKVVLNEEWEHRLYAERDLATLTS